MIKRALPTYTAILLFFIFGIYYQSATAHGGGELILKLASAGPYLVSVWVNPPEPQADEPLHLTIGMASVEDQSPILDATVQIEMELLGEELIVADATTAQSINKLFYEADLQVQTPGVYTTRIRLQGAEGVGETTVQIEVQQASTTNWLLYVVVGLGIGILFGLWRRASSK